MNTSLSITKGQGNIKHNTRTQTVCPANVDQSRSELNRFYRDNDIKAVYHSLFDEAIASYNEKQKRSDRQIKDYYQKINNSKKEKSFHELVVQVGNKFDTLDDEQVSNIYHDFLIEFEKSNPQMRVIGAYVHLDESTPHMHLDYVPWATYEKGQTIRVANNRAISQMGYADWNQWRTNQFELLEEIAKKHNIERKVMHDYTPHMSVDQYKKAVQPFNRALSKLENSPNLASKSPIVPKTIYNTILQEKTLLEAKNAVLEQINAENEKKIQSYNFKEAKKFEKQNIQLTESLHQEQARSADLKEKLEKMTSEKSHWYSQCQNSYRRGSELNRKVQKLEEDNMYLKMVLDKLGVLELVDDVKKAILNDDRFDYRKIKVGVDEFMPVIEKMKAKVDEKYNQVKHMFDKSKKKDQEKQERSHDYERVEKTRENKGYER